MGFKNYGEFLERARMVLKEDAGSEGLAYMVKYKNGLMIADDFVVEHIENGLAKLTFAYPRDYGFIAKLLANLGNEIVWLRLLY